MPFCREFGPTKLLSSFLAKKHPIHNFRSKTHVLGGFAPFGCRKCTLRHRFLGCRFGTSSGRRNYCRVFGQNTCNPLLLVLSLRFGWFRTIWLPQVHRCDIGSWDAVLPRVREYETIVEFFGQKASNPLL